MLRSMTGFGRGEAHDAGTTVRVEVRSVNNRFLDVHLKLPREHGALEPVLLAQVKAACRRGRVDVHLRRDAEAAQGAVQADEELYVAYLARMQQLVGATAVDPGALALLALQQPGVLTTGTPEVDAEAETEVVQRAVGQALDRLDAMRLAEGAQLAAELGRLLDELAAHAQAIEAVTADLSTRLQDRLRARVEAVVGEAAEGWRVAQEAVLQADKADVTEELARLRSHLVQARAALGSDEAVGRRLDFLVQELHREVNTLGSKAVDHPVSARVVELKSVIERLREQAANVE